MFSALQQALDVAVIFTVILAPPVMLFALYQRIKPQRDYKLLKRRVLVYCFLMPFALWIATPVIFAGLSAASARNWGIEQDLGQEDCTQKGINVFFEYWLQSTPFFDNVECITGHESACSYVHFVTTPEHSESRFADLTVMNIIGFGILVVIYCIPSAILYGVLYLMYLQKPAKGKFKADEALQDST